MALLAVGASPAKAATPDAVISGFRIKLSQLSEAERTALLADYERQIAIITSAGLPQPVLDLMRKIPIVVSKDRPQQGSIAAFTRKSQDGRGTVVVDARPLPSQKPILLHEMIHAWDWNAYRFNNTSIGEAFAAAKAGQFYGSPNSHFLSNAHEYFAIAATIYLTGTIQQPPFDCRVLAARQPEFVAFLGRVFGPHDHCMSVAD